MSALAGPIRTAADTVHGLLLERARQHPERVFLVFEERQWTYAEFAAEAARAAGRLASLGVRKGDRVAIMLSNRPEFLFAWFGCAWLGAVEVPVNTGHKGEFLAYVLRQAECRFLIAEAAFWPQLAPELGALPKLEAAVVLDGVPPAVAGGPVLHAWEALPDAPVEPDPTVGPLDPHSIMFTSGTTGPSKGAVMPNRFPLVMAEIVNEAVEYTADDCLYNALPLFHGNAQVLSTLPALRAGARMVLARRFSASAFWDDVRRHGCTEFNYIGGIIAILMKAEASPRDREHSLRVLMGAGAPKDLYAAFESRFGVKLVEGYGMSEIGIPFITSIHGGRPGSCGTPHPWYDTLLVDDDGRAVEADVPGELLVRPKGLGAMMLEYFGMPERTVEAWRDLWFHTGDYLKRDADGHYWFVDRKKDALRRRGENISSWEVERVVGAHEAVLESAAVAAPSELGEDEVMICVALKPGRTLDPAELIAWCEARMAAFMVPRYVRILPRLPKTPTERVQKFELRRDGLTADTWDRLAATGVAR